MLSVFEQNQKEKVYKIYTTECLKHIVNNCASIGGGTQIKQSYIDLFTEDKTEENHEKAQEIIDSLLEWSKKGGEGD